MIADRSVVEHIYIHVPFCVKKCGYCSFYSTTYSEDEADKYVSNLKQEINLYRKEYQLKPKTIYFGGGTPSLLNPGAIKSIIRRVGFQEETEITLEANPFSITEDYAIKLSKAGVNRVSMGVQSMQQKELELLGRLHSVQQVKDAIYYLRKAGIGNISLDLIYGLPDQKLEDLEYSLNELIALMPQHISTYCLSLEEDVPLYGLKSRIPDDEVVADFYEFIRNRLLRAGFEQYEISNFARIGKESKHNRSYWEDRAYLGLGPAAAGYLDSKRYNNPSSLEAYTQQIANETILPNFEELSAAEHESEYIFLQLRKCEGINVENFIHTFMHDFVDKYVDKIEKYTKLGLMKVENGHCFLTPKAYFISNQIMSDFV